MATTRESPYVVKQGRPSKAKKIMIFFLIIKNRVSLLHESKGSDIRRTFSTMWGNGGEWDTWSARAWPLLA